MADPTPNAGNTQRNLSVEDTVTVIGKAITASDYASKKDRARAALQQKDSINKDNLVAKFAQQEGIATICFVFNATGDPIKLVTSKNWNGQVLVPYPVEVENGQWAWFVHGQIPFSAEGSTAAVVYRIKNISEQESDWMFAWDNPPNKKIRAYTEVREFGHFTDEVWPAVCQKLIAAGPSGSDTKNGCTATVCIRDGLIAKYCAVISLAN